jgi:hypothetical protein
MAHCFSVSTSLEFEHYMYILYIRHTLKEIGHEIEFKYLDKNV